MTMTNTEMFKAQTIAEMKALLNACQEGVCPAWFASSVDSLKADIEETENTDAEELWDRLSLEQKEQWINS